MVITCRIRRVDQAKRVHPCRKNTLDPCVGRRVYVRTNDTFVWPVDLARIIITATYLFRNVFRGIFVCAGIGGGDGGTGVKWYRKPRHNNNNYHYILYILYSWTIAAVATAVVTQLRWARIASRGWGSGLGARIFKFGERRF